MADEFLIAALATGNDPDNWTEVDSLLSSVAGGVGASTLNWEYQTGSEYIQLANGKKRTMGLPVAKWTFKALRPEQRENLRDFCSGISADVYIKTPTNETTAGVRTWVYCQAIMNWMERSELAEDGIGVVEMVELTFTHCVVFTPS